MLRVNKVVLGVLLDMAVDVVVSEDVPLLQRLDDVANACEKAANAFLPILNR